MTKQENVEFIQETATKYSYLFEEVDRLVATMNSRRYADHLQRLLIESVYAIARAEREKRLK